MNENRLQIVHNALALCGDRQLQFIYQMTSRYLFLSNFENRAKKANIWIFQMRSITAESSTLTKGHQVLHVPIYKFHTSIATH